ncbi:MAG: phospholipase D-like domain-containing protein, partial [Ktedonobacteraceae bacterium]
LLAWPAEQASVEVRAISNLHAKVWVFDSDLAIVGSGNATMSGLQANLEYGVRVADPRLVEQMLSDWQDYWEQAEPLDAATLDALHTWLEALADDAELHAAEKLAQEKRRAAEQRIGAAPRIGKRLIVAQSARSVKRTIPAEPPMPYVASHYETVEQVHSTALAVGMQVSASQLWQALTWTTPLLGAEARLSPQSGAFLKLTARAASTGQAVLQCAWADGKRASQATIQSHDQETPPFWTVTLGSSAMLQLAEFLQRLSAVMASADQPPCDLLLWWEATPARLFVIQSHAESSVPLVLPALPASMPGNFPALRPPLSQIIIEQEQLFTGLTMLAQNWHMGESNTSLPETIELSFGAPGAISAVRLAIGPMEAPLVAFVPGMDCVLSGPAITLRLDLASCWHILASAQDRVRCWQLCVGRDADAVQFVPEFAHDMAWADTLRWRHELRDVTEG